jgi:hypothetical protein
VYSLNRRFGGPQSGLNDVEKFPAADGNRNLAFQGSVGHLTHEVSLNNNNINNNNITQVIESVILTGHVTMKCRHGYLKLNLEKPQQWCN